MDTLQEPIAAKQAERDRWRARAPGGLDNLEHGRDPELTGTANAIEGNPLTAAETMLVIEQGITVGGKPLKDHLGAIDHHAALLHVRAFARQHAKRGEHDMRSLHRLVVKRSDPDSAGRYADQGRFVLTEAGRHGFPSPAEVPALMGEFSRWLAAACGFR